MNSTEVRPIPNPRIRLNRAEVRRLLRSEGDYAGVAADLEERAEAIAAAAGEGMEVETETGRNRVRVSVRTATPEAARAEAETRALTRALDAGRG
jgi:hypothetical protein